jgi:hypothetical protein
VLRLVKFATCVKIEREGQRGREGRREGGREREGESQRERVARVLRLVKFEKWVKRVGIERESEGYKRERDREIDR